MHSLIGCIAVATEVTVCHSRPQSRLALLAAGSWGTRISCPRFQAPAIKRAMRLWGRE